MCPHGYHHNGFISVSKSKEQLKSILNNANGGVLNRALQAVSFMEAVRTISSI